ncbi:MAG: 1,6-anhydro-N-acetylmuramyl-L-alanine amidase AmpD [Gammaproteobacteria bacterium]|nr:1,6-anhydro-N-acetylmuramyl-L-alanine amidase AmpD [Gammaproteobacteria bacterium]|tara:strand:- start:3608 stop:4147 length:540 start_codon:yes stop_codon:yes gene_type:complete
MEINNHLFKGIKFLKSPNFNNRPEEEDIKLIVIHSISLPPNEYGGTYVEDFFLNCLNISDHKSFQEIKDIKVSAHLYIKRNGEVIQFVPFNKRAWHAGDSIFNGVQNCNDFSIGIELEGSDSDIFTEDQYNSLVTATKEIIKEYPLITKDCITGHSHIAPDRKTDPGKKFDWEKFLQLV